MCISFGHDLLKKIYMHKGKKDRWADGNIHSQDGIFAHNFFLLLGYTSFIFTILEVA